MINMNIDSLNTSDFIKLTEKKDYSFIKVQQQVQKQDNISKTMQNTIKFKQKRKQIFETSESPIKRPKTPKEITKKVKNIIDWQNQNPDNLWQPLPQPIKKIKKLLQREVLDKVYNYIILKQNNNFIHKLQEENCKQLKIDKIQPQKEIFQDTLKLKQELFRIFKFENRLYIKNEKNEIIKNICIRGDFVKAHWIDQSNVILLKFDIFLFAVINKNFVYVYMWNMQQKQCQRIFQFDQADIDFVQISLSLQYIILSQNENKLLYFIDLYQKIEDCYDNNIFTKEKIEENLYQQKSATHQQEDEDQQQNQNESENQNEEIQKNEIEEKQNEKQNTTNLNENDDQNFVQNLEESFEKFKPMTIKLKSQIEFLDELNVKDQHDLMKNQKEPLQVNFQEKMNFVGVLQSKQQYDNKHTIQKERVLIHENQNNSLIVQEIHFQNSKDLIKKNLQDKNFIQKIEKVFIVSQDEIIVNFKDKSIQILKLPKLNVIKTICKFKNFIENFQLINDNQFFIITTDEIGFFYRDQNQNQVDKFYRINDFHRSICQQFKNIATNYIKQSLMNEESTEMLLLTKQNELLIFNIEQKAITKQYKLKFKIDSIKSYHNNLQIKKEDSIFVFEFN